MVLNSLFRLSTSSSPSCPMNHTNDTDVDASSDISDSDSTSTNRGVISPTSTRADEDSLLTPATSMSTSGYNVNGSGAKEDASSDSTTSSPRPSYLSIYNSPPSITYPYSPTQALSDLPGIAYALELFLSSQMLESEAFCKWGQPGLEEAHKQERIKDTKAKSETVLEDKGHMARLYFATGYGLIQCVKGLMSFEDDDLLAGIAHIKHGNTVASAHRKKAAFLGSRLAGYVVSTIHSGGTVSFIRSMTDVERHAELVYAESLFEKALLGIVYSGDWLAFIKEALNMRTTIGIYRQLGHYLDAVDADYTTARGSSKPLADPAVDAHFRSGVYLGVGMCNIVLSLMPGKLMTLVELFGYHGDRKVGLDMLMRAGGWEEGADEPKVSAADEGVRRTICDMALLIFHLVLSSFTFDGVDIAVASKILKWNLKRYPNGVFFLFGAGRLGLVRSQPKQAIFYYTQAMESQKQYRNLHHISFWEIAIANLALWDLEESLKCWRNLEREATWSKAIYSYGMAVCLLESTLGDENERKQRSAEAIRLMEKVPGLRQKIAGKSIPLEKFVARKARKFIAQGHRLALATLEVAYIFHGIAHAPRSVIVTKMLPEVDKALEELGVLVDVREREAEFDENPAVAVNVKSDKREKERKEKEKEYSANKGGYWDDYCLAMFLRGVCMRYVAYPDPDAELDPSEDIALLIPQRKASGAAEAAFRAVFEHGPKIELDHHLVYHAHYELGRLLANSSSSSSSNTAAAQEQFDLILSGKYLEVGPSGRKGKYSMENALEMRTHAAVAVLHKGGRL
ncbi:hypothetical protein M413DRAFT_448267 [Hebeloma cylindrosporum]|uniref:Tetratricopeptide repeat protein 39B n=1 Tax=Hebeloma cylindrosporum TaxID=76867 RepID=A0A0C3BM17_HEBCY|nr:hypothetical protein M413DRAFT_448267 [Hebeloma cylindrosporum h7]